MPRDRDATIPGLLAEILGVLADIRENGGSLSAAKPADGVQSVRVVTAPDPENEKLQDLVFELAGLLEEWRRQPLFKDLQEYGVWCAGIGPRVDAAMEKVEGGPPPGVIHKTGIPDSGMLPMDDDVGPMGVYIGPRKTKKKGKVQKPDDGWDTVEETDTDGS